VPARAVVLFDPFLPGCTSHRRNSLAWRTSSIKG